MRFAKPILIVLSVIVIISYILYELDVFPVTKDDVVEEHQQKVEQTKEVIKKDKEKQKTGEMTKEKLIEKMLDSTLYFDNVQGKYIYTESDGARQMHQEVSYVLDRKNLRSKHHFIIDQGEFVLYSDADNKIYVNEMEKVYQSFRHSEHVEGNPNDHTIVDRIHMGLHKDPEGMNLVHSSVVGSDFLPTLQYFSDWEFDETMFLGFSSYLIEGDEGNFSEGDTFTMIVEKNTGIILDYRVYDKKGDEIVSLMTEDIVIDTKTIDPTIFEPDLTGYKEEAIPDYVPDEYMPEYLKKKEKK
ncbi:MAG TPA: hypothetical protein VIG73_07525 [Cerasibacillus sp.]|uniref:hypothetical protein n=1 Tax=Cerasibacillus sp. TaxID=2498711 RepID=UPI002F412DDD